MFNIKRDLIQFFHILSSLTKKLGNTFGAFVSIATENTMIKWPWRRNLRSLETMVVWQPETSNRLVELVMRLAIANAI